MSDDLARARARVAAGSWLAQYCGVQDPKTMTFSVAELLAAFEAGYLMCICEDILAGDQLLLTANMLDAASRGGPMTPADMERAAKTIYAARDELALERATGQRQLDDATALMTETAEMLRERERHHRANLADWEGRGENVKAGLSSMNAKRSALAAARLEAWLAGKDQYPTTVDTPQPPVGFHTGGIVSDGPRPDIPVVMAHGLNPARVLAQIGETMIDGATIMGVDGASFDVAARYLDEPVEISAIMAPPMRDPELVSKIWADAVAEQDPPAQSLADVRRHWAEGAGFKYWPGGDGPPDDLDENGEVIIDWGEQTESGPRFTMCGVGELTPMPGLWAETVDPESFGTIIGYHADPTMVTEPVRRINVRHQGGVVTDVEQTITYETDGPDFDFSKPVTINGHIYVPAGPPTPGAAVGLGKLPRELVAAEPDPLAALVHARNWLMSAEDLIATASAHIRELTGARAGSDSAELCARLDAWLCPLAERTAPTEEN